MAKVKDEYEKGLIVLDGAMDEERKRQFDMIEQQLEDRKARVNEAKREKEEAAARKAEEARLEK